MNEDRFREWVNGMDPEEAASRMVIALKELFSVLDEDTKFKLVMDLFGDSGEDKVGSMVHL